MMHTSALKEKGNHIADDKDLCQILDWYQRHLFGVKLDNDPAESHIDRSGEKWRGHEDQHGLNDIRAERFGIKMREDASKVPSAFN